jgi:hypothetical protein
MQESDSKDENLYAQAYVKPVYDLPSGTAAFKRNVPASLKEIGDQVASGQPTKSAPEFWVVYLQGAFQHSAFQQTTVAVFLDADPNQEDTIVPNGIILLGATALESQQDGTLKNIRGSLIFVESIRDLKADRQVDCLAISTVHESGHQFGLIENTGGIMNVCTEATKDFTTKHLKAIRMRPHPRDN